MIWYDVMWCNITWYDMIWYDIIWYDLIYCDMIWYDMICCEITEHNNIRQLIVKILSPSDSLSGIFRHFIYLFPDRSIVRYHINMILLYYIMLSYIILHYIILYYVI